MRQDFPADSVCEFLSAAGVVVKESLTFPVHFTALVIISLSRLQDAFGSISVGLGQPSSEDPDPDLCFPTSQSRSPF